MFIFSIILILFYAFFSYALASEAGAPFLAPVFIYIIYMLKKIMDEQKKTIENTEKELAEVKEMLSKFSQDEIDGEQSTNEAREKTQEELKKDNRQPNNTTAADDEEKGEELT